MIDRLYKAYIQSRTVTTDSRAITPGCIFFAFRGEHFDGNAFAPKALEQGAALCVIGDAQYAVDDRCIVVDDVLATLQALAREHRRRLTIPFIGITGTNGKTTTKELVHAVLAKRYKTSATKGNFNNHLGVPLTLLGIPEHTELAIVEMGANHPGEIEFLCGIADPDCGLITNVGRAHLEGFGSFEGVVRTKTELYRHLAGKQGLVFVNADNERLMQEAVGMKTYTYGRHEGVDVRGTLVSEPASARAESPYLHFYFEVGDNVYNVRTHLLGDYNFDNCMAAVAVGLRFGVEPWDIKEAIEEYEPSNNRSEFKRTGRNDLYLDCYNANPSSMAAAIASFSNLASQVPHSMAIIGGMHELGAEEREEHRRVVEQLAQSGVGQVLLVGAEWDGLEVPDNMRRFADTESLRGWLAAHPVSDATILVKGSNTNRLWTLEELL